MMMIFITKNEEEEKGLLNKSMVTVLLVPGHHRVERPGRSAGIKSGRSGPIGLPSL